MSCKVETKNTYSYMCSSKKIAAVSNDSIPSMRDYGCLQTDMTSTSPDRTFGVQSEWGVNCEGSEIECFVYASYGKTAGACSEISPGGSSCLFSDGDQ